MVISQLAFYIAAFLSVIVRPASLGANSGLSYFGNYPFTGIIFGIGLVVSAFFIHKAFRQAGSKLTPWPWLYGLQILPWLIIGVVITPYSMGLWIDWVHRFVVFALFIVQLYLAAWLVLNRTDFTNLAFMVLLLAGGLICLMYFGDHQGFMIQGQFIYQLGFSLLLIRNLDLPLMTEHHSDKKKLPH